MYVGFLATALPARAFGMAEGPILIGAAFLTLFSIANPISLVFVPRFWLNLVLSIVAWFGLFLALSGTIESFRHMGDDGMIFLGAFMIFPVALLAAGILRLARTAVGRADAGLREDSGWGEGPHGGSLSS